jgi:hypothetical protein
MSWGSHFAGFSEAWNNLDFKDKLNAFIEELGEGTVVT